MYVDNGGNKHCKYFVTVDQVSTAEALSAKLDNAFILICLNRFQQIVAVHTFQAESDQLKVKSGLVLLKYQRKSILVNFVPELS